MRSVLVALTVSLLLTLACGGAAEPEEPTATPEPAHPPVTDPTYCRNVSEAVSEMPDLWKPIGEYYNAIWTASHVVAAYYEQEMADKKFLLNIDVLGQLDYIDELATEIKSLSVPVNGEAGHRKAENFAGDMMAATDDLRQKYIEMTQHEGYAAITQHSLGNSPEAEVMKGYVTDFQSLYIKLPSVYANFILPESRGTEYCAGWWTLE